jgi:hypothetical protein
VPQPQHMAALERANENRLAQNELRRAIKAREVLLAEVLLGDVPDYLRNMSGEKLARSVPRLPARLWQRWLYTANAGLGATIGSLTQRQRTLLAARAAEWECAAIERERARAAA